MESVGTESAVRPPGVQKTFVCHLCNFSTHHRSSLSRHKREFHNLGKKFICQQCGNIYRRGEYLKCHLTAAHGAKATADPTPVSPPVPSEKKEVGVNTDTAECPVLKELTDSDVSDFFAEVQDLDLQTVEITTSHETTLDLMDLID